MPGKIVQAFRKTPWGPAARELTLAAGLFIFASFSLAARAEAQRSGFNFLRVPASTRSAAMAGSGASFLNGIPALYANPAGLSEPLGEATSTAPWGTRGDANLMHHEALGDLRQDVVSLAISRGPDAFALSFNTMYSEGIPLTDDVGQLQGTFGLADFYVGLTYARTLPGGLRFGGTLGYVSEDINGSSANTWSGSLGLRLDVTNMPGFSMGLAALYLGPGAQFNFESGRGQEFSLPHTYVAGLSYGRPVGEQVRFQLAFDARKAEDEDVTGHAGLELGYSIVSLRGGARINTPEGDYTAGFGVEAGRFQFDYAFVPFGDALGDTHRAELGVAFGL